MGHWVDGRNMDKRHPEPPKAAPVVQVMSGGKLRIAPECVPDIVCFILAAALPWTRGRATDTIVPNPKDRAQRTAYQKWCEHAESAAALLCQRMLQSVPLYQWRQLRDDWTAVCEDIERAIHRAVANPNPQLPTEEGW